MNRFMVFRRNFGNSCCLFVACSARVVVNGALLPTEYHNICVADIVVLPLAKARLLRKMLWYSRILIDSIVFIPLTCRQDFSMLFSFLMSSCCGCLR
jgi:hypothetical protein